jgi:hypothetical protein
VKPMRVTTPKLSALLLAATTAAALAGCADRASPAGPDGAAGPAAAPSLQAAPSLKKAKRKKHPEKVMVLQRLKPLPHDLVASALIGSRGGRIEIKEAGLRIEFGRGALAEPTLITVTALAGRDVAYEFGPHGLQFDGEVRIEQKLDKTTAHHNDALLQELEAGYFVRGAYNERPRGTALVHELIPVDVDVSKDEAAFTVEHFSGYLLASGRAGQ